MHALSHRGGTDRLPQPVAPHHPPAKADPAAQAPMSCGLSREELRKIVIDLIG